MVLGGSRGNLQLMGCPTVAPCPALPPSTQPAAVTPLSEPGEH